MVYRFHDYTLDEGRRELWRTRQLVAVEPKVFQVLLYLLQHRERMVSKKELLERCWPEAFVSEAALTRCLTKLRKAVQADRTASPIIKTLHGHGYRFVADVTLLPPASSPEAVSSPEVRHTPSSAASTPAGSLAPAVPPSTHPIELEPPTPPRESLSAAERRQLTVLFCDLVGSTALADQLDPEDFCEIAVTYHTTCAEVIHRYGGHIAQYLGDGLLVYFGYPFAHEDDAQRAIHAGLDMLSALVDLNRRLVQPYGIQLRARLGIHTGLVVVGEVGDGPQYGQLALGVTPNIAAKIQTMGAPEHVVISGATYRLVQGYFVCEDLGEHTLPGVEEPLPLYQVLHVSEARGRLEAASSRGLTPLVGRDAEMVLLQERWAQVQQGIGQVVMLSGEAGIGKSRLVRALIERLGETPFTCLECRCSPYYQHTALYPVVDLLQRSLRFDSTTPPDEKIMRLEGLLHEHQLDLQENLPLLASLLSLFPPADRYPPLQRSPQQQRQQTLDTLLTLTLARAEQQPMLFIVEDLHWIDPSTLEWLGLLIDRVPTTHILTLMTCRPTFQAPWWGRAHVTSLTINRLLPQQVAQMAQIIVGADVLPADFLDQIVTRTDGVPLFVEEVTRFMLASQQLHGQAEEAFATALSAVTIPTTLHDLLMARLDQMGAAKGTAQLAATIGREFGFALLQAVASVDETALRQDLRRLVDAELLYQRGVGAQATYVFKHTLIQEAAYTSLLRRTRQHYHQWIAQALDRQSSEEATVQPELVAHHYTEAGLHAQALPCWQKAGQQARERSAHAEAMAHLTKALELLTTLPDTPERARQELSLHIALGATLAVTKGYGNTEVERVYSRARELCQQTEETIQLFPVQWGLWTCYIVQAKQQLAREVGTQLLSLSQHVQDSTFLLEAHLSLAGSLHDLGEFTPARNHWDHSLAYYDRQQHRSHIMHFGMDLGVFSRALMSHTLWHLGYPDQALTRSHEALALAEEHAHPFSQAIALAYAVMLHQFRHEQHTVYEHADTALALCAEQGFAYYLVWGTIMQGWSLMVQGQREAGIEQMRQGLAALRSTGAKRALPYYLALLAEGYGAVGQTDEGLCVLAEAFAEVATTAERRWEAELYRLQGELLLRAEGRRRKVEGTPEACFRQALAVARQQQAKALELRAAVSLSRFWQQQGKRDAARQLLAEIYGWFSEGFDTRDLQEAKVLLEHLA
jgi:predicted ATPase/class 3 adenylate cyclase/DNA-binding winged helix-turn-helix (wHTH) protein